MSAPTPTEVLKAYEAGDVDAVSNWLAMAMVKADRCFPDLAFLATSLDAIAAAEKELDLSAMVLDRTYVSVLGDVTIEATPPIYFKHESEAVNRAFRLMFVLAQKEQEG